MKRNKMKIYGILKGILPILVVILSSSSRAQANISEQVVGFYTKGSLINASALPFAGVGFVHLFQERNRHYGVLSLVHALEVLGRELMEFDSTSERLQIGDISAQNGGPISRHGSHQNGLDVDVVYLRVNRLEQSLSETSGFVENFVSTTGKLSENFDLERNWFVVASLVKRGIIGRIFVDTKIKQSLCEYSKTDPISEISHLREETLRRLRPWPNHADHMHIRFKCQAGSPRCVSQDDPPLGDGC